MSLRSRSFPVLLFATLVLIVVVGAGAANRDPAQVAVETEAVEEQVSSPVIGYMTDEQAAKLKPVFREIHEVIVAERLEVQALEARLKSERDPIAALEIQREISDSKKRAEIEIFRVQATHAHREGRVDQAREAEAVVEKLQAQLRDPGQAR